jgi:chaperone BCS1
MPAPIAETQSLTNVSLILSGAILALIGLATAALRDVPGKAAKLLKRQVVVSVDIVSGDQLFEWLRLWFDTNDYTRKARLLSATAMRVNEEATPGTGNIIFTPAPGAHLMFYHGRPLWVKRERKDISGRDGDVFGFRETFTLSFVGRNQEIARKLLTDVRETAEKLSVQSRDIAIRVPKAWGEGWEDLKKSEPRALESVVLDQGIKDMIVNDLARFRSSEAWYKKIGVPYHRGYLFYGEPGSGKSSLSIALAGHFKSDIYLFNLNSINDRQLYNLMSMVPAGSAILLEDIDAVFTGRATDNEKSVSFSGLLNALDGIGSKDGNIVFMSTNHIEQLDPALLRAGRSDLKIHFGSATRYQTEEMFARFFPEGDRTSFGERLLGQKISMAALQEYLLDRRESLDRVMNDCYQISNYKLIVKGEIPYRTNVMSPDNEDLNAVFEVDE